jgi:hypothetical protein
MTTPRADLAVSATTDKIIARIRPLGSPSGTQQRRQATEPSLWLQPTDG